MCDTRFLFFPEHPRLLFTETHIQPNSRTLFSFFFVRWQVSQDAVAISHSLFWEKREYWRVFTAAFAHYEQSHLGMNAFSVWNIRALETFLGTFRYLCLVSDSNSRGVRPSLVAARWLAREAEGVALTYHGGVRPGRERCRDTYLDV